MWRRFLGYLSRASENSFPLVEMRVGKSLQVERTARAKVRWNLTRRSYFHRYNTPLLRNPQSGIYWPGSFPALKQLESHSLVAFFQDFVGSWTVGLSALPLVGKVQLGGAGIGDSDTRFFAASPVATWTSGPYSSPCLFLVAQQHPTGRTQRAWPTYTRTNWEGGQDADPAP